MLLRRNFITSAFWVASLSGLSHVSPFLAWSWGVNGEARFRMNASARKIGTRLLDQHPARHNMRQLAIQLREKLGDDWWKTGKITKVDLNTHLSADFLKGETVLVDGWVLSSTEAQLYAFAKMTSNSSIAEDPKT